MEEKKRVRPTVAQVKGLETELKNAMEHISAMQEAVVFLLTKLDNLEAQKTEWTALKEKYEEQIEGTSSLVADCDAWREKYKSLEDKYKEQIEGTSNLVADCNAWREEYRKIVKDRNGSYVSKESYDILKQEIKDKDLKISELEALIKDKDVELRKMEIEVRTYKKSNELVSQDLERSHVRFEAKKEECDKVRTELMRLRNRNIIERIINR